VIVFATVPWNTIWDSTCKSHQIIRKSQVITYGLIVVTLLQKTEISAMFNPKKQQHLMLHQHLGISFDQRCRSIEVYKIVKRHFGQVIRWAEPAEYRKPLMGIYYISILYLLGGGFKHFLFSPLFGEDFHFDIFWLIFFKGVETTSQ